MGSGRYQTLTQRVRIAAAVAALRGLFQMGVFVFIVQFLPEEPSTAIEAKMVGRVTGLLVASLLGLACAWFLWRRCSLVAAYILAVFTSLDVIYKVSTGGVPFMSAACAAAYIVAVLAIHEMRRKESSASLQSAE